MENAASSTGDLVDKTPLRRSAIMLTYGERRFINRRSCWPLHTFGDHRLRTHGDLRFIDRRSGWPNFDDHRLRTHGDRHFIDRRSCWPYIASATTTYTHMENAASSIGDHVDLWRTPLQRPAIMLTFVYLRRPPTTHAWRSPFHRPAIMLTLHNFGDHRLLTTGELRFIYPVSARNSTFLGPQLILPARSPFPFSIPPPTNKL